MSHNRNNIDLLEGQGDAVSRPWLEPTRQSLDSFPLGSRLVKYEAPWGDANILAGRVFTLDAYMHAVRLVVLRCDSEETDSDTERSFSADDDDDDDDTSHSLVLTPEYWFGWLRIPDDLALVGLLNRQANLRDVVDCNERLLFIALCYRRLAQYGVRTMKDLTDTHVLIRCFATMVDEVVWELEGETCQ